LKPIIIKVIGIPGAQGSKRHVGNGIMIESSRKVPVWRQDILHASLESYRHDPVDIPCHIEIDFFFPRPLTHFRTGKFKNLLKPNAPTFVVSQRNGDIDKLCRSTLDGLSITSGGIVLKDDSLVVSLSAKKAYVGRDQYAGANILILPYPLTS
jgi:crossover junction endodeoxyribonuclease RusA